MAEDIADRGLVPRAEFRVKTPGGYKPERYVDVVALDPVSGIPVEFHQVGALNINGSPVAREMRGISDIVNYGEYPGVLLWFHEK